MNKPLFITAWLVAFLMMSTVILTPSGVVRCSFIGWPSLLLVIPVENGYEVFTEEEFDHFGALFDRGGMLVVQRPRVEYGPWEGVFELYTEHSYMPDPESIRIDRLVELTAEERSAVHAAVVERAKTIPEMAAEGPGKPARRYWAGSMVLASSLKLMFYLGVPTLVAVLFERLAWLVDGGPRAQRVRQGRCGTCGYDCRGLGSEVCPECGQEHGVTA